MTAHEQLVPSWASDEMTPLEPADRHLVPLQKLPTSKQQTPHLVADKKINSSHKKKVPQQKARRHVLASPPRLCGSIRLFRNAVFRHNTITVDTVIPSSSTLVDRPPSLLPFPIVDQGQPLFSPESTSSHTDQVLIDEVR